MKDTMERFLEMFNKDISNYTTKINLSKSSSKEDALSLALDVGGDWQASCGISYEGKTITLEVYSNDNEKIRFLKENDELLKLSDEGVYLCLRLKDTARIGDTIEFSPYGSEKTYEVKVAGYLRSLESEYELSLSLGFMTYLISIGLTFGVSILVGWMVSRKNKKIDMVEALKGAE